MGMFNQTRIGLSSLIVIVINFIGILRKLFPFAKKNRVVHPFVLFIPAQKPHIRVYDSSIRFGIAGNLDTYMRAVRGLNSCPGINLVNIIVGL